MFRTALLAASFLCGTATFADTVTVGPRPLSLVEQMTDGPLKDKLTSCAKQPVKRTLFSIAHRGAPLQLPEHTIEGYTAAAQMGAGIVECDVTFTKDKELVCRHAQDDLHSTTNILETDLAAACTDGECRASDVTLEEFKTLQGTKDGADNGQLMTHTESIELFKTLGVKFTPELKAPVVDMPYDGFSQEDYAQAMIDAYKDAGVPPADVWPQSFNLDDVLYWIKAEPAFGAQAVLLEGSYRDDGWSPEAPDTWPHSMAELKAMGVNYIAPPLWVLLKLEGGKIVPSTYAVQAKAAGLEIIAWTIERSGPLNAGGGWYYQSVTDAITSDGMLYEVIDVLAQDVGVAGIFSDWPGTTSYYASCMGLK